MSDLKDVEICRLQEEVRALRADLHSRFGHEKHLLEVEIKELKNEIRIKEQAELWFQERVAEASDKIERLTEDNKRLQAELDKIGETVSRALEELKGTR